MKNALLFVSILICLPACTEVLTTPSNSAASPVTPVSHKATIEQILASAARIPTRSDWFEVLRLPNSVYAFWEPGHEERVNAFLILGSERDLLYDTGMGIANIADAINDVRAVERLPDHPLMVVNSHNHLDHNGGNKAFSEIWTVNEPWGLKRLELGVPAGEAGGFVAYWDQLRSHEGVSAPADFSPLTHEIPPYPRENIRFLGEGQIVDLGNRSLQVMRMFSHSPDGISLFNQAEGMFFGGDTFYGANFLVTDMRLLATDLERIENLSIKWHYSSHGPQLVTAMEQGQQLATVNRIIAGEGTATSTTFAGAELPVQALDGVTVTIAKGLLLY